MFNNGENGVLVRPDVSKDSDISKELQSKINWVGMDEIRIPLSFNSKEQGLMNSVASVRAVVSLDDKTAKGIHMSRIFLQAEQLATKPLTQSTIEDAIKKALESHSGLSKKAKFEIKMPIMLKRKAL